MAESFKLKDGTEYLPDYNMEPGMNDDLAYADRAGWQTSVAMLTGGQPMDWDQLGSLEVAPSAYAMDPMGEDREMLTFGGMPKAKGHIGEMASGSAGGMQPTQRTLGGKSVDLGAPQTYNNIAVNKKNS